MPNDTQNRLERCFAALKLRNRKALITYTMAGDPDADTALAILERLAVNADILEIGMPFSDPVADGPTVQAAGLRSLANGGSLRETLLLAQKFRSKNKVAPIILMGYFNPILHYGVDKFINECNDIGIDGVLVADIPPEEADEITPKAQQKNVAIIRLVTPTTDEKRLPKILKDASGFLYYVAITGVTGTASADAQKVGAHITEIKKYTDIPVVAGFGIRTPEDVTAMAAYADGVVVGSALVGQIETATKGEDIAVKLGDYAAQLAAAL